MILDYFDNHNLSPQEWEELIDSCYSLRYPGKWHKTPSAYMGDCGIEGFTDDGIAYQCYCPEQPYSNDNLYTHQRDKLTTDIAKLFDPSYIPKLIKLFGRVKIKEWHLVVPEYKDRRIIEHANSKELYYLDKLKNESSKYPYMDSSLRITVMQADCFIQEISQTIRSRNNRIRLRIDPTGEINFSSCDANKVENIKRKIRAIQPQLSDDNFNKLVDIYIKSYLEGVSIINHLRVQIPSIFAELHNLMNNYKSEAEIKTTLNANSATNKAVFYEIMSDFLNALEQLEIFDKGTTFKLKNDIIAGWLADCSMEFVI